MENIARFALYTVYMVKIVIFRCALSVCMGDPYHAMTSYLVPRAHAQVVKQPCLSSSRKSPDLKFYASKCAVTTTNWSVSAKKKLNKLLCASNC